eukprot:symbB.v1.2.000774.t1/scaffold42.1/size391715/3
MLIHMLQKRPTPVLPSLQDLAVQEKLPPLFLQGFDCRYCSDEEQIRSALETNNEENEGELLLEFFRHFGYVYDSGAIAIRDTSSFTFKFDQSQSFFVVDNPFEPGKDVANIEVRLFTRLREEFRRVSWIIWEKNIRARFAMRRARLDRAVSKTSYARFGPFGRQNQARQRKDG